MRCQRWLRCCRRKYHRAVEGAGSADIELALFVLDIVWGKYLSSDGHTGKEDRRRIA